MSDPVNHPAHYTAHPSGVECITVTEHMGFNVGNAVKYLWRAGLKSADPIEDLKKAVWYAQREIRRLECRDPELPLKEPVRRSSVHCPDCDAVLPAHRTGCHLENRAPSITLDEKFGPRPCSLCGKTGAHLCPDTPRAGIDARRPAQPVRALSRWNGF